MTISKVSSLAFLCAAILAAQDKVTVPLSNPAQPATLRVHLMQGGITVTGGAAGQIVIESGVTQSGKAETRLPKDVPPGMKRIDSARAGMDVTEDHNVVTISTGHMTGANLVIQVPANCSLQLKTMNGGGIEVTGVSGELDLDNLNGPITLRNVSGSVLAHSLNGAVTAVLDKVTPDKPMAFTSMNGKIDVTLPGDTKARVRLKTDHGAVYSDFEVKMEADAAKPVTEDARSNGGKYRIKIDRSLYGSINGGGPEYRFETMNGNILIHRK